MSAADGEEAGAKETLDALLKKNREHERHSSPTGRNNHVPMALIALYRLGAAPARMQRYADGIDLSPGSPPAMAERISPNSWRDSLGRGSFAAYVQCFDGWIKASSSEAVLKEAVPVLMKGSSSVAYHALLRLGYAIDYGSQEEMAFSLAYWAAGFYPGPAVDAKAAAVEPDTILADAVKAASGVRIKQTGTIDGNIRQVYGTREFASLWRPVRVPDSNPLARISELILATFTQSQHFTLLHALTSCQSLRLVLPYVGDVHESLGGYWHSVVAAYLTVACGKFEVGKDTAPDGGFEWAEVIARAAAAEKALEHTVKLTYSCRMEFEHYKRMEYRALAIRELKRPSPFV